mmetsp:Transcript_41640/g.114876  ORF Transcript_41640/g.114876 Transcript_41640/m.114876 type:complete len:202 (+) Transcript_41640:1083-1688(+)
MPWPRPNGSEYWRKSAGFGTGGAGNIIATACRASPASHCQSMTPSRPCDPTSPRPAPKRHARRMKSSLMVTARHESAWSQLPIRTDHTTCRASATNLAWRSAPRWDHSASASGGSLPPQAALRLPPAPDATAAQLLLPLADSQTYTVGPTAAASQTLPPNFSAPGRATGDGQTLRSCTSWLRDVWKTPSTSALGGGGDIPS